MTRKPVLLAALALAGASSAIHAQDEPPADKACAEGEACETAAEPMTGDGQAVVLPDVPASSGFDERCGGTTPWMVPDPQAEYQRERFRELCQAARPATDAEQEQESAAAR